MGRWNTQGESGSSAQEVLLWADCRSLYPVAMSVMNSSSIVTTKEMIYGIVYQYACENHE